MKLKLMTVLGLLALGVVVYPHSLRAQVSSFVSTTASLGFSSTQGVQGWTYLDSAGSMTYDTTTNFYRGSEQYALLWSDGGHPGSTVDSIRRWTATTTGNIQISGNVRDNDSNGGDGVDVFIKKNGVILWQQRISNGNTTGYNFNLTTAIVPSDTIDFVINKISNNNNDSTYFNPTIVVTTASSFNPFGMGAAYSEVSVDQPTYRERQLQQTVYLAGKGGNVRLWCRLANPSECQTAISRAYALGLTPLVLINDSPWPSDTTSPHVDFSGFSTQFANYISALPRVSTTNLYVELMNEPNFTDWWLSGSTCDATTRAHEIAEAAAQITIKVKALNDSRIKILGVSLSPYSDSNPTLRADGKCDRGTTLDLASTFFVTEMKNQRPDLFPMLDGWNSHPYGSEIFGLCTLPNCPSPTNDPAMKMYQQEMNIAGVSPDLPIYLTEVGTIYGITSSSTADRFVNGSNMSLGAYPQVWLTGGAYNNVRGIIGFILPIPGFEAYAWLNQNSTVTSTAPYQTPYPIYTQVRALRKQMNIADLIDQTPPAVSITSPLNNSLVSRSTTVNIQATASDLSGILKVEFTVNGALKCTDTSAPYSCAWAVPGSKNIIYTLQAKAYDGVGNTASSSVKVTSK